jgi:phytoene desaturase
LGVQFKFGEEAAEIIIEKGSAKKLVTNKGSYTLDVIISGADYHFTESALLPLQYQSYTESYWDKRVLAPSCLLYYVGLNKKLKNVLHHSLFFDVPFEAHGKEIYTDPQWPTEPLFYLNVPSKTDAAAAPEGCENLMFLIPIAAGLKNDSEEVREHYFNLVMKRLERHCGEMISNNIIYKKTFSVSDFINEYHSYKGNAYGLANTLKQTALLKPSCQSKKVKNLFYTGQLTVPGPGVPPCLISGEVVSKQVIKMFNKQ